MNVLLRTAKEFDLDEICKHLLVVGDLSGDCFNCKEIGIDYSHAKQCPQCKTEFRYIASRKPSNLNAKVLSSLCRKRPELAYIEFDDVKHYRDREKAKNFFS